MRIDELSPEQARWVILPVFAWTAIETKANAGLAHLNAQDPDFVGGYELAEFMDAALGPVWRRAPVRNGLVRRNLLEALKHEIEIGRWVVLRWTRQPLVEWVEDSHAPDGGRWQLNHRGRTSSLGSALQSRLNRAYREQEAWRARAKALSLVPLGQLAAEQTERVARARAVSAQPPTLTKAQRWQQRKALIAAGRLSPNAAARTAAERLAKNNVAVEYAKLAQSTYKTDGSSPEGWDNRSTNVEVLEQFGLKPRDLKSESSNFAAQLYEPDPATFGNDMKPAVGFKGSELVWEDWNNNFAQSLNLSAPYYQKAINIGKKLALTDNPIDLAGHSLGGSLCSAASVASGKDCWSFNAAGLHPQTVERYGGTTQLSTINAYHVKGEILTSVQRLLPVPEAAGLPHEVEGASGLFSSFENHRIANVIDGIEKQKAQDMTTLQ
jgi:hypothetical protein